MIFTRTNGIHRLLVDRATRRIPWRIGLFASALLGMMSRVNGAWADDGDAAPRPSHAVLASWNLAGDASPETSVAKPGRSSRVAQAAPPAQQPAEANLTPQPDTGRTERDQAASNPRQRVVTRDQASAPPYAPLNAHAPPDDHALAPAAAMEDLSALPRVFRPSEYERYHGEGEPLLNASWLNRPYYAGFFLGALNGDTLIPGEINQSVGFMYGFRLGWDYDTYWGLETRLGFSELGLDFIDEQSVDGLSADVLLWDCNLVYYPWGDSRWRPYVSLGLGLADWDFLDEDGLRHSDAVVGFPWGFGFKYRQSDWITLRFDFLDNIAFGGKAGFETMNNLSMTGGLEFRFGGTRRSYFPWNPSRHLR